MMHYVTKSNQKYLVLTLIIKNASYKNKNVHWEPNQHIRMISEGSCDAEDWSNDAENSAFVSTWINYMSKNIKNT